MTRTYEDRLGSEKLPRLMFRMALPAMTAQLVNLLYNIVDKVYIGHIPGIGTDALAGVGVTGSLIILIAAFSSFIGGGGAPLAAIALGHGDRERAERILGNGVVLLIIFTVLTTGVVFTFMRPLLFLTGASSDTVGYATDYLSVYLMGTLFVQITTGLNSFISAQGRSGVAMLSVLIGAVLNIVLDPLFIFVLDMNVAGAALATVISQFFSTVFVIAFLTSTRATLRIRRVRLPLHRDIVLSVLALGVSPFVMACTESLIGFVLNGSLAQYGDLYVSTLTVMQSAVQIVSVPLSGISQGMTPILSYNYGHGNHTRVRQCFRYALTVMFSINFLLIFVMIHAPETVAGVFTDDPVLIASVGRMMPVFATGMSIFGLQRMCQCTFVALGQAGISLFIALLRKVILLVPLALVLPRFFGVTGIYLAESVADATAALTCMTVFLVRFPQILQHMESSSDL